jgi:predicted enzyme related to lactoylglutathione lyase
MERSRRFYEELFGFACVRDYRLPGGGTICHMSAPGSFVVLELLADGQSPSVSDSVHLGFCVDDFEEAVARLTSRATVVVSGPVRVGSERIMFIADPDGYMIEVNDGL